MEILDMIDLILPLDLQHIIVETIKRQCYLYQKHEIKSQHLYYEPYSARRKKYSVTAAVLSGFAKDRFSKEGIHVDDLQYGLSNNELFQTEITTDTAIIQIYSNSAKPLINNIVKERCREYNGEGKNKRFVFVQFWADKNGNLGKIEAKLPDKNGQIREIKLLYKRPIIATRASAS